VDNLKQIFLTVGVVLTFVASGQVDRDKIISSFDLFDYYPDSTIKCAYKIKKGIKSGYAIEFDQAGQPVSIGKYKGGNKDGNWRNSNGLTDCFKGGQDNDGFMPGCGTGVQKAKDDFQKLYIQLINTRNNKKQR
jgi:hypothetical protein